MESIKVRCNRSEAEMLASLLLSKGIVFGEERAKRWPEVIRQMTSGTDIIVIGDTAMFSTGNEFDSTRVNHVGFDTAKSIIASMPKAGTPTVTATSPARPVPAPVNSMAKVDVRREEATKWGARAVDTKSVHIADKLLQLNRVADRTSDADLSEYLKSLSALYALRAMVMSESFALSMDMEISAAYSKYYLGKASSAPSELVFKEDSEDAYAELEEVE